jgi:hypothetical protein
MGGLVQLRASCIFGRSRVGQVVGDGQWRRQPQHVAVCAAGEDEEPLGVRLGLCQIAPALAEKSANLSRPMNDV